MKLLTSSFLLASIMVMLHLKQVSSQEVDDEREFNYIPGSDRGPEHWGEIHPEWALCGNGTMQSPIDIRDVVLRNLGMLVINYMPSHATLVNRGHDIMVRWENGGGSIVLHGKIYTLRQVHWHSPSEHTIYGNRYALEAHLVHQSIDNKTTVIAILYKLGMPDPFLFELQPYIKAIADQQGREKDLGVIDPRHIIFSAQHYYRYMGSLTTPPCTENVTWTIIKMVRTVSLKQVKLLRMAVNDDSENNARPIQPTNGRPICLSWK